MNRLNEIHQEAFYDNSVLNKQETGNLLDLFSNNYTKEPSTSEKNKDISCIYNEFLKNTLDFSETPGWCADKLEEDIFFSGTKTRKDFDLMKTRINRKLVDFFNSDQERESDLSNENKPAEIFESLENFQTNLVYADGSRLYKNESFNQCNLANENQLPQQSSQTKITSNESSLEAANYQDKNDSDIETNIKQDSHSILSSERISENKLSKKVSKQKKTQDRKNNLQLLSREPNNSSMGNAICPSLAKAAKSRESNSYLKININLAHPFITKRKSIYNENLSTKAPSQSSLQSPASANKWAEVSVTLHSSVSKGQVLPNKNSQKISKKKKLKTSCEGGDSITQIKQDKHESLTDSQADSQAPSKDCRIEDTPNNFSQKNINQYNVENHSHIPSDKGSLERSYDFQIMNGDAFNSDNTQRKAARFPVHQSELPKLFENRQMDISEINASIHYNYKISKRSDDSMNSNILNHKNYSSSVSHENFDYSGNDNQISLVNPDINCHRANSSPQFVQPNLNDLISSQHTGRDDINSFASKTMVIPKNYHQQQNYSPMRQIPLQQQVLSWPKNQSLGQQTYQQALPHQPNYSQQPVQELISRQVSMQQQQPPSIQHQDASSFTLNSSIRLNTKNEHSDHSSKCFQQNSMTSDWKDSKNMLPQSSLMQPRISPETVFAVLNQHSTQDLLGNLNLPPEITEEIRKSNIIGKIQNAFQRKIGLLTVEERRAKLEKYFEKRKQKVWNKKINYQSRKQVADKSERKKGRFATQVSTTIISKDNIEATELNNQLRDLESSRTHINFSSCPINIEDHPEDTELAYQDNTINPLFQEEYDRLKFLGFN